MNHKSNAPNASENRINPEDAWLRARAVRSLLRCDQAETVQGIASYVISKYGSLRVGSAFMERNRQTSFPLVAAFLGAATRFLEVRASRTSRRRSLGRAA